MNNVDLNDAMTWCSNWREKFYEIFGDDNEKIFRGFYIPIMDFVELMKFPEAIAVRGYIAMEDPNKPETIKLLLVPVYPEPAGHSAGKDKLISPPSVPGGAVTYNIFDFTRPCPMQCDKTSPLYNSEIEQKGE
jgi:hypothetical protein